MRVVRQPCPVLGIEPRRILCQRCLDGHRPVTGEHAATQEAVATTVGRKLIIAVQVAVADALAKPRHDALGLAQLNDPLNLDARTQPKIDTGNDAKQSVSANRQAKQFCVLVSRTAARLAAWEQEIEALDLLNDRLERQSATVGVAR